DTDLTQNVMGPWHRLAEELGAHQERLSAMPDQLHGAAGHGMRAEVVLKAAQDPIECRDVPPAARSQEFLVHEAVCAAELAPLGGLDPDRNHATGFPRFKIHRTPPPRRPKRGRERVSRADPRRSRGTRGTDRRSSPG